MMSSAKDSGITADESIDASRAEPAAGSFALAERTRARHRKIGRNVERFLALFALLAGLLAYTGFAALLGAA